MYAVQLMMGTFHFGLCFGRRWTTRKLQPPTTPRTGSTTAYRRQFLEQVSRIPALALSAPLLRARVTHLFIYLGMTNKSTCFVCLAQLLIALDLQCIPAFNLSSKDWNT